MIKNKRILITGMAGSIGSELARQLAPANKLFGLDINESGLFSLRESLNWQGYWVHSRTGDIRNKETLFDVFSDFKPQIVIHAAALKHVTPCEEYPREAVETNIEGTLNLAEEAKKWECLEKFIFISTDKVVNAKCIMGITKLAAESIIRNMGKKFVAVRFGNVMMSRGSVLELWKGRFEKNLPLPITDVRMERYMMSISQACELVKEAGEKGNNGELWIINMGKPKNILKLKEELYGKDYPIKIIGIRKGEVLSERLMTEEEKNLAVKRGKFYIIDGKL